MNLKPFRFWQSTAIAATWSMLLIARPAIAHHPFGGETPDNAIEGLLSGFGHPVIGLDHLVFVVASGLIALGGVRGFAIPTAFVLATAVGTLIHLQEWNLPAAEICIAASVVIFGVLIALRQQKEDSPYLLSALAAIAGIFHGYAYGEAVVGAQMAPIVAYLVGFMGIELAIALAVMAVGNLLATQFSPFTAVKRLFGWAIGAIGLMFLVSSITG